MSLFSAHVIICHRNISQYNIMLIEEISSLKNTKKKNYLDNNESQAFQLLNIYKKTFFVGFNVYDIPHDNCLSY